MAKRLRPSFIRTVVAAGIVAGLSACAKNLPVADTPTNCAPDQLPKLDGDTGTGSARAFFPDPIISSGQSTLSPTSLKLDSFATPVTLNHLGGHGVLEGDYVDVRNGSSCSEWFGAYDLKNSFVYPHSDARFQEAMVYHWGDQYRSKLSEYGYVSSGAPVEIVAHCQSEDNAFFVRGKDTTGQAFEIVCLGDSVVTPGAYYSDDATVSIHELQHATTTALYSATERLNRFWYDEAGALNEAISDFMALTFTQPFLTSLFDARLFSRWALGTFIPHHSGARGAHKCPAYDPTYPNCGNFPAFSAANNTISYVYPDGMGWPYANNFTGPGYANSAFGSYRSQEEIHNAGILLVGALWDVYDAIKTNHGGDEAQAHQLSSKVVLEALRHLPPPTSSTPVTFRGLADQMVLFGPLAGLTVQDQISMSAALTARGLLGGVSLPSTWSAVGPGSVGVTPGLRVQDNPTLLKSWLIAMRQDPNAGNLVPQGIETGLNNKLDPGELTAVWFDIENTQAQTAGGVLITVTSLDPDVTMEEMAPADALTAPGKVFYNKINGTSIVTALTAANPTYHVATGNTYFRTNPFFDCGSKSCDRSWTTALWVKVSPSAAHGKTVHFQVVAQPSNGAASTSDFTAIIN